MLLKASAKVMVTAGERTCKLGLEEGYKIIGWSEVELDDGFDHIGCCDAFPRPSDCLIVGPVSR
jgi:hypothetical protein